MNKTSIKSTIGDIKTHVNNEDVIIYQMMMKKLQPFANISLVFSR